MRVKVINLDRTSIASLITLSLIFLLITGAAVADVVTPEVPMGRGAQCVEPIEIMPVSYTHLTLPTSDLV